MNTQKMKNLLPHHAGKAASFAGAGPSSHMPSPSTMAGGGNAFDLAKLGDESLDVELYVRGLMQKLPNEESVQQLHRSMADSKDIISQELQKNVYRNYNEFVVISKEINKLEGDMISVRRVLGSLKDVREKFGVYGQDVSSVLNPVQEEKKVVRPEELARQKVRDEGDRENRQMLMKAMYKEIEGLQKSLSENPGRELLLDGTSIRVWDINPQSYKQREMIFIHVLSDAIILAAWKKNLISGKNRISLEKTFAINEIGVIDMKDSPEMLNAFKILKGAETLMFRAETLQEKKTLLGIITEITSEIVAKKKLEIDLLRSPTRTSILSPSYLQSPATKDSGKKKQIQDGLSDIDYRWLLELSDELDVLIAQRDFGQAIVNVEKARHIMAACTGETARLSVLRSNIEERVTTLSRLVSIDLTSPAATKTQIQEDIKRLLRLGLGDQARDIYLTSRSSTIKHRLRQLQYNGDIVSYMIDYSEVFFRLIKNTCEWFQVSFHDASMASGFMKWIQEELYKFAQLFKKQTFNMQHEFHVIADCVITAIERCQDLNSIGMDLTSTFESLIKEDLIAAIEEHTKICDLEIFNSVKSDAFELLEPNIELFDSSNVQFSVPIPQLSLSGCEFYEKLTKFGSDIGMLISFPLYNTIVSALGNFFVTYISGLKVAVERNLEVYQYIAIMTDASFVIEHIFPTTKSQVTERFERTVPELEKESSDLSATLSHIRSRVISQIQTRVITIEYNFGKIDYSSSAEILDNINPSQEMINLINSLRIILNKSNTVLNGHQLIQDLLLEIFNSMDSNQNNWLTPKGPRKFGYGGVQLFLLDMHFLLHIFDSHISPEASDLSNALCERALRSYFVQNKDLAAPLRDEEFYDARVAAIIKEMKLEII